MSNWFLKKKVNNIDNICSALNIHKPLAYALAVREIKSPKQALNFLNSRKCDFENINNLKDVTKAYSIIKDAIDNNIPICVYGDYDADGVLSTTILCKMLKSLGANFTYFIPNRIEDGYGLSDDSVRHIANRGIKLIITCDNGIAAPSQIDLANELGMKVVVLDHHEPAFIEENGEKIDIIPNAEAVIDAKLKDSNYSFREMCAGGLCYRFAKGFFEYLNKDFSPIDDELMVFAGMATICDVVDLVGENRTIAQRALHIMNEEINNIGLRALIEVKDIEPPITSYHIGFVVGPCINASGRLDSASIAVELLLTNDEKYAKAKAKELSDINEERKALTQKGIDEIIEQLGENPKDKVIIEYNPNIHESIAGIIAGRIREKYNKPTIILTHSSTEGIVKGSARSIEKYNIFEGLYREKALLDKFGGHAMAAGLSLLKDNIVELRNALNQNCGLEDKDFEEVYRIDGQLTLNDVTEDSIDELAYLQPYGKANEKPLFGSIGLEVNNIRLIGKNNNFIRAVFRDEYGNKISGVDFNNYDKWVSIIKAEGYNMEIVELAKPVVDIVYELDINSFNGYRNPQIKVKDIRISKKIKKMKKIVDKIVILW